MTADEALDTLGRVYHSPLIEPIRQELVALREKITLEQEKITSLLDTKTAFSVLITRAEQQRDAARAEVEALRHDIARHVAIAAEQAQEIERLRTDLSAEQDRFHAMNREHWRVADENGRLRASLREIAAFNFANHPTEDYENQLGAAVGIARAALAGKDAP